MLEVSNVELDYKQVGLNIARRRKELHLKQVEVCEMADLNDKYLSCIETARSIPSLEVFLRICNALNTTPDHLLIGAIKSPDYSEMTFALLDKFQTLSPENQRLCLAIMDLMHDNFNDKI
ncbi:MAG: helix-turn-helix transcriptional regulator [Ruminococcus sp.]|nr:helix-turn-helix transcriptional regulator [Ruminococcus sp.]MBR6982884.1 helix-turn-helix transcriptional regulator [Ruminococcus sp.]